MKTIFKVMVWVLGFIIFIAIGVYSGLIDGGSYPYAQQYEFNANDSILIKAVKEFKRDNPNFKVPKDLNLPDTSNNYRYNFYLYYVDENKLIHCFIMTADGSKKSSIYLHAINDGLVLGNWKIVNRDYNRNINLKVKKDFTERFLNKLKLRFKDEGNASFIFWK